MKWCEHIEPGYFYRAEKRKINPDEFSGVQVWHCHEWNFCPICGTPRPIEKSMRERMIEEFREQMIYLLPDIADSSTRKTGFLSTGCASRLADIALKFIEEENAKKA